MPKGEALKQIEKYATNDPFEIAKQKGIIVIREKLGSALGYYNSYKRIRFIHINEDINEKLAKFVCAHELGHSILHPDANAPFMKANTFLSIDRIEVEANTFAVELLLLDKTIYEHQDLNMTLEEVASMYCVPNEVAHLKNLRNVRLGLRGG